MQDTYSPSGDLQHVHRQQGFCALACMSTSSSHCSRDSTVSGAPMLRMVSLPNTCAHVRLVSVAQPAHVSQRGDWLAIMPLTFS